MHDDVAFDSFIPEHTMNPEAVQPRLLNDDDRKVTTRPRLSFLVKLREQPEQLNCNRAEPMPELAR
jgi:hypothetical protein